MNLTTNNEGRELILIVEDDKSLRDGLKLNFELQGYRVEVAVDGDEGMKMATKLPCDLIVLDVMLPGHSGLEILAELRRLALDVLVLILSARDGTRQKIEGLGLGADDYVTKPFELAELLARVEAMLRRRRGGVVNNKALTFGQVTIDIVSRSVTVKGQGIELTSREYDLLYLMAASPGKPFTREEIIASIWGENFDGTERTVDNYIVSLRQKIERNPSAPKHIKTVRRVGYKLEF